MDNLDDSENNAKISDSAYSNSCSNSQSRRSHSSKSTHSGSNSSGSSGYGGKPSTSGSSNNLQPPKEPKKKKILPPIEILVPDVAEVEEVRAPEPVPIFDAPKEETHDVIPTPTVHAPIEKNGIEKMDICPPELTTIDEVVSGNILQTNPVPTGRPLSSYCSDGFSCVISMHDGVVMYATSSMTTTLGFPKDMWTGRSFIDFVHPRDRNTFASQITNGLAVPKTDNGTPEKVQSPVCRIRRYRGLTTGFGVKERLVGFMPFLLKLTFKNISDEEGKVTYLVIQATPFYSAFKTPNEIIIKAVPFVIRHAANGLIEYVDPESVPYLGYLPQDLANKDALMLYHPEDLMYMLQVYDTIVKEGGLPRSKPYRLLTQNGDYVRLETEWSSFINPWSKKLEFVIGKHHILEGPNNPDVFQAPDLEKSFKKEKERSEIQIIRENILRTMNEALTKPAELAKQQMSKRCQDLASFMESLMEETKAPKTDEELRLDVHEPDHSYYERDSVMLGGISPHHEFYDSKSGTETPLSYTQLNYNETLQRYFSCHQPISYGDNNLASGESTIGLFSRPHNAYATCLSPMAQHSRDSGEITCSSDSNGMITVANSPVPSDYQPIRLSEALLNKHNAEMEKELLKMHRETRSSKGEREKNSNETRKKKKEHLARCNATYHPTSAGVTEIQQPHGLKRTSKMEETEASAHKHHCPSTRQTRRIKRTATTSAATPVTQPTWTVTTTAGQLPAASSQWSVQPANNMSGGGYILGVGYPQQMSIMSPMPHHIQPMHTMPAVQGMYPMYYAPAAPQMPTTSVHPHSSNQQQHYQAPMMMYGHPMYGPPVMYSPMTQQVSYPMQQTMMAQSMQQYTTMNPPLGLTNRNYEESTDDATNTLSPRDTRLIQQSSTPDKTDGESSYSSFYSSFFKTESGSAEDSGDGKNGNKPQARSLLNATASYQTRQPAKKFTPRRKMEPPWMEQVCVTSELVYKYQVQTKSMEETLLADKQMLKNLEQPALVNEQLSQLYLDLQLEGVAARLTLEEGITSSSSSGEDSSTNVSRSGRKKRECSKLVMIYEEDAPLPEPDDDTEAVAATSNASIS